MQALLSGPTSAGHPLSTRRPARQGGRSFSRPRISGSAGSTYC